MDKEHFNRILRDVEANTLRLQEHGKDVLILERVVKQRGLTAFKYEHNISHHMPSLRLICVTINSSDAV